MKTGMKNMFFSELNPKEMESVSGGEFPEVMKVLPLMNDDEMERFEELTAQMKAADAEAQAIPSADNATRALLLALARYKYCAKVAKYHAAFGLAQ